ncbi:MAG TPA: SMC family ATPase [Candidatus Janibacter merdipullorum]|nr:SMC family ATPase [Candidatus Janibacter merdipullorum]
MRLHHLSATAFGPFADTVDLDLEAMSESGLFLVHGPTGSGKTSLLDAICFALYAGVPGERQATTLRSHHAEPDRPTVVVLELTLDGRRLRITRSPAHERPKKRGTGTTTEPARVQLDELVGGTWTSLSSRIDETARVLDDLLGMALDQFRRVVMLPQGDFAAFLRATDEERREVLERLFDVTDYVGVEHHLVERRQQVQAAVAEVRSALAGHTLRLEELLAETDVEVPEPETPWAELDPADLVTAVRAVDEALGEHASEIMALVDRAQQEATRARAALTSGNRLEEHRSRGAAARAVLAEGQEIAEDHASRRVALSRAREARAVLPHVEAVRRSEQAFASGAEARESAISALVGAPAGADLALLRDDLERDEELLSAARHEAESLGRLRAELPRATALLARREAAVEAATADIARAGERAEELREAHAEVLSARERIAAVTPVITLGDELMTTRRAEAEAEAEVRRTTDGRQSAQQDLLDRREHVQQLTRRRLDTMAAELADQLTDGEPCSVCGALEHPEPARSAGTVDPALIEAAEGEAASAEAVLEHAQEVDAAAASRLDRVRVRRGGLEEQLAAAGLDHEQLSPADLAAHLEELRSERATLGEIAGRGTSVEQDLTLVTTRIDTAESTRGAAAAEAAEARALLDRVREEIVETTARATRSLDAHDDVCPCERLVQPTSPGPGPLTIEATLGAAIDHHDRAQALLARAIDAGEVLERAGVEADAARTRLETALGEHEFIDAEAVLAALLDGAALRDLERVVDEHERRLAAAESVLAEDDVVAALASDPVDLIALRSAAVRADEEADTLTRRQASSQTVLRQFRIIRDHVHRTCTGLGTALEEAEVVTRMSALVTGTSRDNDKRMRLSTYVLAARLERIVELANERLLSMADGRYELGHDDSTARGQRRGGLGLVVRDLWTGMERPTDTLSGGESFTASLALALGMADAIREESGGQEFGILFVDEGFGSLDQDSLEQVLDLLDRLRDGGRTVGVVSHVSEMRTRIPAQVRVDKTPHGSSLTVLREAAAEVA